MQASPASEPPPLEGEVVSPSLDTRDALLPLANMANAFELRDRTHLVPLWGQGTDSKWNWSDCWDEILKQEELERERLKGLEVQPEVDAAKLAAAAEAAQERKPLTPEEQAQRVLHLHAKDLIMKLYAQSQYMKTRSRLQRARGVSAEPELPSIKDLPAIEKSIAAVQALGMDPAVVLQQAGFSSKQVQLVMQVSKLAAAAAANGDGGHDSGSSCLSDSGEFARSPLTPLTPDQTFEVRSERVTMRRPSMSSSNAVVVPPESLMLAAPQSFRFRRSSSGVYAGSPSPPPGTPGSSLLGPVPSPSPQRGPSPSTQRQPHAQPEEDSVFGTLPGVRTSLPLINSPRNSMVLRAGPAGSPTLGSPLHSHLQGRSPRASMSGVGGGGSILAGPSGLNAATRVRASSNLRSSTSSLHRGTSESGALIIQNGAGASGAGTGSSGGAGSLPPPSSLPPLMGPSVSHALGGTLRGSFRNSFRSPPTQRVTAPGSPVPVFLTPQPPPPPTGVLGKASSIARRHLDMDVALSMP